MMKKSERKARKKFKEARMLREHRVEVVQGVSTPEMVGPVNYVNQIIEKLGKYSLR